MAFRCRVLLPSPLLGVVCLLSIKGICLSSLFLTEFHEMTHLSSMFIQVFYVR
ncbi:predicted protein [Arabidopsis lyrata subsp. lyrata]|uniref:Predicted protein n=1 Tax=Arabidopsis lyrata subsp. lyrata TaxID=81972 RepID=D7LI09_ARALL|nr:predicted protein [Arabidopsis lyrata subsp. lyrata]